MSTEIKSTTTEKTAVNKIEAKAVATKKIATKKVSAAKKAAVKKATVVKATAATKKLTTKTATKKALTTKKTTAKKVKETKPVPSIDMVREELVKFQARIVENSELALEVARQRTEEAQKISKKIWLAGLGAYGVSFDQIQQGMDKAVEQRNKVFKDLVERGEKIQENTEAKLSENKKNLEDRIVSIRESIEGNYSKLNLQSKLDEAKQKLEEVTYKLKKS